MKHTIVLILTLFFVQAFAQRICHDDIMNGEKLESKNVVAEFANSDFSDLWLNTNDNLVYGVIGQDYQRLLLKFLVIEKNRNNGNEYFIVGKSSVKNNVCKFVGKITITKIQFLEGNHRHGLITAKYELFEDKRQNHSGAFEGILQTKWFSSKENKIQYDDTDIEADGYFNNAFTGTWKMYNSSIEKRANWGDYRVPNIDCNFDIGAAEISVSEKYWKNGWLDIVLNNKMPNENITQSKEGIVSKKWWE